MTSAQRGDAEAYARLLDEVVVWLRARARRGVGAADAAEDVVQNVLLAIHRARHTWRPQQPLGPWLSAVVRNAIHDHHRLRLRRAAREVALAWEPEAPAAEEDGAPRGGGEALDDLAPELRVALAELPPAQREAVELLHLEALPSREAEARTGVSAGTLRVRAHRGIQALRKRFGREGR